MQSSPITAVLIGAGSRGYYTYGPYALQQPGELRFAAGKLADTCFNMPSDQEHTASTLAAIATGYDVLLEKPMATCLPDTVALVQAAERAGRLLQICHVLRYTPFFATLHQVLTSGR